LPQVNNCPISSALPVGIFALAVLAGVPCLAAGQAVAAASSPAEIARALLDDSRDQKEREALAREAAEQVVPVVQALVADLPDDEEEEYRRIPWIWRISVAAGRSGDLDLLKPLFDLSMPQLGAPLRDWESVVLGGGVLMGLSQGGKWPDEAVAGWVGDDAALRARWEQALRLSSEMADNDKVRDGTRYDALRTIGVGTWEHWGPQLVRYLESSNAELQLGAVGGLGDMRDPRAAEALVQHMGRFTEASRRSALNALVRTDERRALLRKAIAAGTVQEAWLSDEQRQRLTLQ
jgi:hypothetical protein